ncbi:hypothetical protein R5R35_011347 [Gryllus longicercus]|uniref:Uncharacterized protein n=1 Tax=Gryllus longicercus TaxID=2509291 RepID=A0AAN9W253_9ORTH
MAATNVANVETAQPRAAPREYRGKPENQRDPRAKNAWKPKPEKSGPQRQKPSPLNAPPTLPPPTQRHDTSHEKVSTASPADSSVFAPGMSVRETVGRETFTPSAPALIDISRQTYSELVTDDSSLSKVILPEYLDYYATALLWMRIVTLKEKNAQPLTEAERELLLLVQSTPFALPEPLLLAVRSLGNITTGTKQHLYPEFPPLPVEVVGNHGGYYGPLAEPAAIPAPPPGVPPQPPPPPQEADLRHNLYEEIPCLGVLSTAIRRTVSNLPPGVYASDLTFRNQAPTNNLLGFRPLGHRRPEAKNLAFEVGITDAEFPAYPRNSGFSIDLLIALSNVLANTKTFKITQVVFSTLSEIGAQSQIVIERPLLTAATTNQPALRNEIQPTCLIRESESIFGSGVFFCLQLYKESLGQNHSSWSLFPEIPQQWVESRNQRRNNLPVHYRQPVFQAVSQHASSYRMNIIRSIVISNR